MLFPEVAGWIVGPLSEGKTSGRGFFIWRAKLRQACQVKLPAQKVGLPWHKVANRM